MQENSMKVWGEIERTLPQKRVRVLRHIAKNPEGLTLFELVKIIGRPVNEISGRVTELSKGGFIIENGKRSNPDTNKSATIWIINPKNEPIIIDILSKENE